ncbi:glycosyltransferase [Brevibacterium litoralis]|uniref:glycosyltransferase n=1 Tax=Brevibacterium litoralis TaxID=3138935 RepID=UPI0032F096FB
MSVGFVLRQAVTLVRTVADHVAGDPVFFGMQVARRAPARYVQPVGRAVACVGERLDHPAVRATGQWLAGAESQAKESVSTSVDRGAGRFSARVLGELALAMGQRGVALDFAAQAGDSAAAAGLRARIHWFLGDMSGAIDELPSGAYRHRLEAERTVMQEGWTPTPRRSRPVVPEVPATDVLFSLTNSLPHTQSGYTLRTHSVLRAVRQDGIRVLGTTRTGYPTAVGRFGSRETDVVEGVPYVRDVPWNQGRTLAERLEAQTDFLEAAGRASGARVLHTTTHFTNGLAVREAARRLGIPWVYEVRGVLEETWASSRGSAEEKAAAHASERFRLFREREIDVATTADHVVTLGYTMAAELERRGVDGTRILVAPNAVGDSVLQAQVERPTAEIRADHGLPTAGIWVGTAASIVGYEGLDTLLDAVALARQDGQDVRALIVGDGVELPTLKERARELGLLGGGEVQGNAGAGETAVVFTGRVPQAWAQQLVTALDVFVVPRRDDPVCALVTPIKPVEAAGLGRPVVVSDLPALTEALPAGAFCAVPPDDAVRLAPELVRLAADPDLRRSMARAGRDYVQAERRWETVARGFTDMYRRLGVEGAVAR